MSVILKETNKKRKFRGKLLLQQQVLPINETISPVPKKYSNEFKKYNSKTDKCPPNVSTIVKYNENQSDNRHQKQRTFPGCRSYPSKKTYGKRFC